MNNTSAKYFAGAAMLDRSPTGDGFRALIRCPVCGGPAGEPKHWYPFPDQLGAIRVYHRCNGGKCVTFTLCPDVALAADNVLMPVVRLDVILPAQDANGATETPRQATTPYGLHGTTS